MPTTVTSTIGTGGDYTTVQAWEDASPANLVTDDKIWKGLCKNQEFSVAGTALTVSGSTVDSTRYKELTTDTGASFRNNANVQTNALRYNSANGAAIKSTNSYATCIVVSENYFRISNLQVAATGAPGTSITASGRTGVVCDGCIVESNSAAGMTWYGSSAVLSNTLVIQRRGTGSSNYVITFGNGGTVVNCTLVGPSDLATKPANAFGGVNYGSATLKNTAVFGCTALEDSSTTFTYSGNATDLASPPSGWTGSLTYSSQFQTVTTASSDFRLKSGANLIDACTADTTLAPIDIAGTTRATGASQADIGAWEFVSAGGSFLGAWARNSTTIVGSGLPGG